MRIPGLTLLLGGLMARPGLTRPLRVCPRAQVSAARAQVSARAFLARISPLSLLPPRQPVILAGISPDPCHISAVSAVVALRIPHSALRVG